MINFRSNDQSHKVNNVVHGKAYIVMVNKVLIMCCYGNFQIISMFNAGRIHYISIAKEITYVIC